MAVREIRFSCETCHGVCKAFFSIFLPFLFCMGFFEVTDSIPRSTSIMGNCMIPSLFVLHSQRYIAGHQGGLLVPLRFTRPRHLKFLELPGWEM